MENITREKCGENIDAAENKSVIVVQRGTSLVLMLNTYRGLSTELVLMLNTAGWYVIAMA